MEEGNGMGHGGEICGGEVSLKDRREPVFLHHSENQIR
jgi:hypothetical protein